MLTGEAGCGRADLFGKVAVAVTADETTDKDQLLAEIDAAVTEFQVQPQLEPLERAETAILRLRHQHARLFARQIEPVHLMPLCCQTSEFQDIRAAAAVRDAALPTG